MRRRSVRPERGPWIMAQRWHDLLFAHWPLPAEVVQALLPASLEVETFDGAAWLGVVPFWMSGIRPRGLPAAPWLSTFPELNVRTYVTHCGRPGVWFFSLDAANPVAVRAARRWYNLPYFDARMASVREGAGVRYASRRTHRGARPAAFRARYAPCGPPAASAPGSLDHWLTARDCLYSVSRLGELYRAEIEHRPWPLQPATAVFKENTMAESAGFALPDLPPRLLFSRRLDVRVWRPRRVGRE